KFGYCFNSIKIHIWGQTTRTVWIDDAVDTDINTIVNFYTTIVVRCEIRTLLLAFLRKSCKHQELICG
ncbi:hypothetical protein, partial [Microcoleus sp. MON2_D5]|uniref:hypothetical protein n=1 Tax=Microcoleus sp. MON2_D5 TaxID=2818833 RepID=UPI002FCED52C